MKRFYSLLCACFFSGLLTAQPVFEERLAGALETTEPRQFIASDSVLLWTYGRSNDAGKRNLLRYYEQQIAQPANLHSLARSLAWKGIILYRPPLNKPVEAGQAMQQAVSKAVESGDEYLMVQAMELTAYNIKGDGKAETALFYFLKAAELREKLGDRYFTEKNAGLFASIGDLLYKLQEYTQAAKYMGHAVRLDSLAGSLHPTVFNTLGLAYQRVGRYDSALYWFEQSRRRAAATNDTVWQGIVSGNVGALYFDKGEDDKALPLLWNDYFASVHKEPNSAANTLHRIALIYLHKQKTDSALVLARRGYATVSSFRPVNDWYLLNAYKTLGEVYRKTGRADSAFFYNDRYQNLKDSLQHRLAGSLADLAKTRLEFEKKSNFIAVLLAEKAAERNRRNLLVGGMALLLISAWLYIRWQRQRHQNQQQALRHQKAMAHADAANAREQLESFTQNILSKNELIEHLQAQLRQHNMQVNEDLLQHSLLTETDWLRFREMFDRANPGFLARLQQLAPGITTAELRLAALLRLNLGNKHIASMLGIGADAVRKTKSRLRQRLRIAPEHDLDDYVRCIPLLPAGALLQ